MSWLCSLYRASLSLFFSCKSSDLNLRPCSSFFRIKRIKTYHFWTTPSTMFLSPVSLSYCTSSFLSLQIFPLLFSYFLSFLFWTFFFFLSGQKVQFSISFTSFTKSLVIGTLAILSIFNEKGNKMIFWINEVRNCN